MLDFLKAIPTMYIMIALAIFVVILMLGVHIYTYQLAEIPDVSKATLFAQLMLTPSSTTGKVVARPLGNDMINSAVVLGLIGALGVFMSSYALLLKGGGFGML
jgi:hypothetical protein